MTAQSRLLTTRYLAAVALKSRLIAERERVAEIQLPEELYPARLVRLRRCAQVME